MISAYHPPLARSSDPYNSESRLLADIAITRTTSKRLECRIRRSGGRARDSALSTSSHLRLRPLLPRLPVPFLSSLSLSHPFEGIFPSCDMKHSNVNNQWNKAPSPLRPRDKASVSPRSKPCAHETVPTILASSQTLATTSPLPISMDLPVLHISQKQNEMM